MYVCMFKVSDTQKIILQRRGGEISIYIYTSYHHGCSQKVATMIVICDRYTWISNALATFEDQLSIRSRTWMINVCMRDIIS